MPEPAAPQLASMAATLCCYESQFGPYHPLTLKMMTEFGCACARQGQEEAARRLLERAVRDLTRFLGPEHEYAREARRQLAWISGLPSPIRTE